MTEKIAVALLDIKLNHRKLLDGVLDICGVPSHKFCTVCSSIDKLDKQTFEQIKKELIDEKGLDIQTVEKIGSFVKLRGRPMELLKELRKEGSQFLTNDLSKQALNDLDKLFRALDKARCVHKVVLDLSLARGLDYYTGVIYEAVIKGATQVGSIASGGRYDNLIGVGTKSVAGIGVSIGIERVFTIMEENQNYNKQLPRASETQVLVSIWGDDENLPLAAELASMCWDAKLNTEFLVNKRRSKHFDRAKEITKGVVTLKNKDAQVEKEVPTSDFVDELVRLINTPQSTISLLTMAMMSIPRRWKYDVFVSYRGEDIRKGFMDHLFNDFKQKGIHAFRDDRELPKGEEIYPHLYKAIEESRFLIVIFSKNYASSSWCLRELVKILQCKQMGKPKHEVQIIFYDVKPDLVRKQTGSYAGAFAKHDVSNRTEVDTWREALSMAANLSGWDLQDMTNGFESKFIDSISRKILKTLCDGPLHVGENLVGIDFHFDKLDLSRFVGSDKVNMIGICGISGIGKTTLAKAIYNLMYVHFEGSCFCEDLKEVTKRQGLIQVQLHMIGKIMNIEDLKISTVGEGSMIIKQRMACKPILLVLDDVNNMEQLDALAGSPDWFFPGSLLIFTGKDKQLLRSHKVDGIYDMETLDDYKSLELFSLYAFRKRHPTEDFEEFAFQIVKYLHGHPLALKVFGRLLYDKSVYVWKSELDRLQTYPNSEIVQKLRPSFDNLASDHKRMFLDIACVFIGENKDFAASVLDSSHSSANAIIEVLADKFLITVSADCLQMHELIQSMAREIIREELRQNHRRWWISSEDYDVLNVNKVTEEVEVLVLLLKKNCQNLPIDGQAFTRMKNLRILKICFPKVEGHWQPFAVNFSGRLDFLSNKLRLLYWHGLPLKFLPSDFYPENIVTIDLSYSHIKHLWTTPKCFMRLKFMKLRYCCYLTSTPDFSEITNLEELTLEGCENLVKVHPSIGMLKKLVVLNMRNCKRVKSFPSKLEMVSLQILILSGCLKIEKLPEDLGRIKSLTELHIDRTSITELPLFGQQESIRSRWLTSTRGLFGLLSKQQHPQRSVSMEGLHMLNYLNFSYCNLVQVPDAIGGLSCLKKLHLEGNSFTSLPGSLSQLSNLQKLRLDGCKKLEVLPELPPSVWRISACDCTSLRLITGSIPFVINRSSYFSNCPKLFKNLAIDSHGSISETQCLDSSITSQGSTNQFSSFLRYAGIQNNICEFFRLPGRMLYDYLDIIYHGNSIPEWFTNKSMGNHVKVELPSDQCFDKFRGYGTCVVFKRKKPCEFIGYSMKNFDGASLGDCFPYYYFEGKPIRTNESYMIWLRYTGYTQRWEEAKNFVTFCFEENNEDIEVKECGARVVCDVDLEQDTNLNMFQDLPALSQHGGSLCLSGFRGDIIHWTW